MIKGWDDAIVVDVPVSGKAKNVTLVYPYYRNRRFLKFQIECWLGLPSNLKKYLRAIIVDDGSPGEESAHQVLRNFSSLPFPIRLFAIDVDIRFNWLAARNIAMYAAAEGWCAATDMDHVFPLETIEALINGNHNENVIYRFSRKEHTGKIIHPHPNSWFMTRKMFWKFGGYDENFSGLYGTDGEARRRWVATAKVFTLKQHLLRYEYVDDSSTTIYKRKLPHDNPNVLRIINERGKDWKPKILSFPYHEVSIHA